MGEHGPAVMRHQDPASLCRTFEEFRIADALKAGFGSRGEVNAGFPPANCFNDSVLEIGVRSGSEASSARLAHFCAGALQLLPKRRIRLPQGDSAFLELALSAG